MRAAGAVAIVLLAIASAWLAVANKSEVLFSLDALRPGGPGTAFVVPLFAVLLAGALIGILIGGIYMSGGRRALKRQLREERTRADRLQGLLADETLGRKPETVPTPKRRLLSRMSG